MRFEELTFAKKTKCPINVKASMSRGGGFNNLHQRLLCLRGSINSVASSAHVAVPFGFTVADSSVVMGDARRVHNTLAWQWAVGEDAVDNEEADASPEEEVGRPFQRDGYTIYVCKRCRTSYSGLAAERTIKSGRCFQCQHPIADSNASSAPRHEASSLEPIPAGGYGSTF